MVLEIEFARVTIKDVNLVDENRQSLAQPTFSDDMWNNQIDPQIIAAVYMMPDGTAEISFGDQADDKLLEISPVYYEPEDMEAFKESLLDNGFVFFTNGMEDSVAEGLPVAVRTDDICDIGLYDNYHHILSLRSDEGGRGEGVEIAEGPQAIAAALGMRAYYDNATYHHDKYGKIPVADLEAALKKMGFDLDENIPGPDLHKFLKAVEDDGANQSMRAAAQGYASASQAMGMGTGPEIDKTF